MDGGVIRFHYNSSCVRHLFYSPVRPPQGRNQLEVLVFEVGDKRFGVHSGNVREVVRAVKLSPLPEKPDIVEGLLNLRGQILPVVDVRRLFSLAPRL